MSLKFPYSIEEAGGEYHIKYKHPACNFDSKTSYKTKTDAQEVISMLVSAWSLGVEMKAQEIREVLGVRGWP